MNRFLLVGLLLLSPLLRATERPPNIVYLIADDHSWTDYGFMGNERVHTPNLDKLARQSAQFPNGYLNCSVCRPSLVTLLTGLYQHQHGIHFNHGPPGNSGYNKMTSVDEYVEVRSREFELIRKVKTLPGILSSQSGYRCLQTGKFWEGHWRNGGFTEGMTTFTAPSPSQTFGGIRKLASGDPVAHGNGDHGLQIGRETMQPITDFIVDCEKEKTPWLVWYAPYLPHQPHDAPEKFVKIVSEIPGVQPHEIPYFASIAQFDETVGTLIDFVETESDPGNTLFVFVADNGWSPSTKPEKKHPGEFVHTKNSKRAPFDEGIRSPILIRWDGKVTPAIHSELVSSVDIVPTLITAAGAEVPANLPGKNLLSPLQKNRTVFGAIYPGDATTLDDPAGDVAYLWARQGKYKLIKPAREKPWQNFLKKPALFDVEDDPKETRNLIDQQEFKSVAEELSLAIDLWYQEAK